MFQVKIATTTKRQNVIAGSFGTGFRQVSTCKRIEGENEIIVYCAELETHGCVRRATVLLEEYFRQGYVLVEMH